jgi:hypothetical protein
MSAPRGLRAVAAIMISLAGGASWVLLVRLILAAIHDVVTGR